MERKRLIEKAYTVFSSIEKPVQCTRFSDYEDAGFNSMLLAATRRGLSMEQVGTVAWSPIPSMVADALAYFMPRLIELAITNTLDRDGDPFFCHFINSFHTYSNDQRFRRYGAEQKKVMVDTFIFLCQNYPKRLKSEGWWDMAQQAAEDWGKSLRKTTP